MAKELQIDGRMRIDTLQKEFNETYSYLRLGIYSPDAKEKATKGLPISQLPEDITIAKARTINEPGEISLHGLKKVKTLEHEFEEIFGLYVQVCYTTSDGKRGYTSGQADELSISELNKVGEKQGWKKDIYR